MHVGPCTHTDARVTNTGTPPATTVGGCSWTAPNTAAELLSYRDASPPVALLSPLQHKKHSSKSKDGKKEKSKSKDKGKDPDLVRQARAFLEQQLAAGGAGAGAGGAGRGVAPACGLGGDVGSGPLPPVQVAEVKEKITEEDYFRWGCGDGGRYPGTRGGWRACEWASRMYVHMC